MNFYIKNILLICTLLSSMTLFPSPAKNLKFLIRNTGKICGNVDNRYNRERIAQYVMKKKENTNLLYLHPPISEKTKTTIKELRTIREEIDQLPKSHYKEIVHNTWACHDFLEDEFPSYEQLLQCIQKATKDVKLKEVNINTYIRNTIESVKNENRDINLNAPSIEQNITVDDILTSYNTELNKCSDLAETKRQHAHLCMNMCLSDTPATVAAAIIKCLQGLL